MASRTPRRLAIFVSCLSFLAWPAAVTAASITFNFQGLGTVTNGSALGLSQGDTVTFSGWFTVDDDPLFEDAGHSGYGCAWSDCSGIQPSFSVTINGTTFEWDETSVHVFSSVSTSLFQVSALNPVTVGLTGGFAISLHYDALVFPGQALPSSILFGPDLSINQVRTSFQFGGSSATILGQLTDPGATTVPEPGSSLLLLSTGLVAIAAMGMRRTQGSP